MTPSRTVTETIPAALAGERIDRVVAMATGLSRRQSVALVADGSVTVDGQRPAKPSERVEADSIVVVQVPPTDDDLHPDSTVPFDVVHGDQHVAVIDKPAGIVVHPGSGVTTGTLVQGLLARFPQLAAMLSDPDQAERPGIVHRLDRGTSGLLVVALSPEAHRGLVEQFSQRRVNRRYRALVVGQLESDAGLIDAPLGRSSRDPTRRAVVAGGKVAKTHYRVAARFDKPDASLVDCRLETGRTHQIRAHFAAIGHPIVGDDRYGGSRLGLDLARPFLHAAELGFEHPVTGRELGFESPLPDDLMRILNALTPIRGG